MTTVTSGWGRVGHWLFGRTENRVRARADQSISEALERIPLAGPDLRERLEAAACRRDEGGERFVAMFIYSPLAFVIWIPLAGMAVFGGARLFMIFTAVIFTCFTVMTWRTVLHRLLFARLVFPLTAFLAVLMWGMVYSSEPGLVISSSIALFSMLVLVLGSLPAVIWLYRKWRNSARQQAHAYDALAMAAVHVVDVIHGERHRWHHGKQVRRWCELLENFAVEATVCLSLKDRVDPADTGLRRELREEALRVAEAIRLHKRVLVTANCTEDVDGVVESLVRGIDALVREDRSALLANAPDLPSTANRLRVAGARLLPGAVVIGSAFALPLVPGIPPSVEESARWMLALVGASMILSSSPEAVGTVRDVLGKVLPFK
ncbi:hypothetical protein A3Q37_00341 [Streptomyces sp. PTY087I2]|nr:hypothetical protein A3Q37_00341 [Streptomyces sp. PTY087I2]